MAPRRIDEASHVTSALTGINLAVSIVREAADALPIVKQVLGAAVRVVAFAEKIDKDREALRGLGERSLQLAQRVTDAMDGRTPSAKISSSLERIHRALDSIATFMEKHSKGGRLRRAVGYAFTVPQHVDRMSRELVDAEQELIVVALLDVNHQVYDNAQYDGQFRLLRHCDVEKLDLVMKNQDRTEGSNLIARYYNARVDGRLLVVRFVSGTPREDPCVVGTTEETPYGQMSYRKRMVYHDRILEELSTLENSHRNVIQIYGWSKGSRDERFVVFKSGFGDSDVLFERSPSGSTVTTYLHLDAAEHLRMLGIIWDPEPFGAFQLNEHLEPIIGLNDDLHRRDSEDDPLREIHEQMWALGQDMQEVCTEYCTVSPAAAREALAGLISEQLDVVLGRCTECSRGRYIVPKCYTAGRYTLSDGNVERLRILMNHESTDEAQSVIWTWPSLLLMLSANRSHVRPRTMLAVYQATGTGADHFIVLCLGEDSERIVCDVYEIYILDADCDEVAQMLGVSASCTGREQFVCTSEEMYSIPE